MSSPNYVILPISNRNRWNTIVWSTAQVASALDLANAIMKYNPDKTDWTFDTLLGYFDQFLSPIESQSFFKDVYPRMHAALSASSTNLIQRADQPNSWKLLNTARRVRLIELTEKQSVIVLVNCFFCTWPGRSAKSRTLGNCNFQNIFAKQTSLDKTFNMYQKLNSFIHYFVKKLVWDDILNNAANNHRLLFYLNSVNPDDIDAWKNRRDPLIPIDARDQGTIEDQTGTLQADFANAYVGGGVVGHGAVQEEIRFFICPDLMVGRLVTPKLRENEALRMRGTERVSKYTGYSMSYAWDGDFQDQTGISSKGFRDVDVVAFDAMSFRTKPKDQTRHTNLARELNKAFAAFTCDQKTTAVSTGNWGGGAFGGSVELKFLLQWIAASRAKRSSLRYLTFGAISARKLNGLQRSFSSIGIKNSGELLRRILDYRYTPKGAVIDFILHKTLQRARRPPPGFPTKKKKS